MEELQYDYCERCNSFHGSLAGMGLIANLNHSGNTITYRAGNLTYRMLKRVIAEIYGTYVDPFAGLLEFKHLKAMPDYETASWLDKRLYQLARESDLRTMLRLKTYLELEEQLYSRY